MRTAACDHMQLLLCGCTIIVTACGARAQGPQVSPPPANTTMIVPLLPVTEEPEDREPARAGAGDTVAFTEYTVLASKRMQFEDFLTSSYWPALRELARWDSLAAKLLQSSRVLRPLHPAKGGTYSYLMLLDPAVSTSARYSVTNILKRAYPGADSVHLARFARFTSSYSKKTDGLYIQMSPGHVGR